MYESITNRINKTIEFDDPKLQLNHGFYFVLILLEPQVPLEFNEPNGDKLSHRGPLSQSPVLQWFG